MRSIKIHFEDLVNFCFNALVTEGMDADSARITAEILSTTDMMGTFSHGTKNLHNYIKKVRKGGMSLHYEEKIISESNNVTLLDAKNTIGMVAAHRAMEIAINKSNDGGIAMSTVINASHFGAAGYYALMAAKQNKIGIVLSNVDANMTIPGAIGKVLGNNPIAYAVPSGKYPPLFLDIAMSSVASLKVIQAKKDGVSIPNNWIIDKNGFPTTDPSNYPDEGAMIPLAAHKGYGLALMVEILTGVLSGGGIMKEVPSWLFSMEEPNNVSQTFIVIDTDKFIGRSLFNERMEHVIETIHQTPMNEETKRLYYPGEIEWEKYHKASAEGLLLPEEVFESLMALAEEQKIDLNFFEE